MDNFTKLNQVEGVCQLLAFARMDSELAAVFDFDEKTLGEAIVVMQH